MPFTITPQRLNDLLQNGDKITVLDVRRAQDRTAQAVPGAEWRDPTQVDGWKASVPRDRTVVIYCARGGSVSKSVLESLRAQGTDAVFIEGGIEAWTAADLPLTQS